MLLAALFAVILGPEVAVPPQQPSSAQLAPVAAASGNHVIVLWRDAERRRVSGVSDGHPFSFDVVSAPVSRGTSVSMAAGDQNALVVWSEGDEPRRPFYARRIGYGGEVLDPVPIFLGTLLGGGVSLEPQGVAFDGDAFVVAWPAQEREGEPLTSHVARISPNGAVLQDDVVHEFNADLRPLRANDRAVVMAAQRRLVASPWVYPIAWYGLLSGRTVLAGSDAGWAVAAGPSRFTFVAFCGNPNCRQLVVDQELFDGSRMLRPQRPPTSFKANTNELAMVWSGAEYVLAWSEWSSVTPRIRAVRLNARRRFHRRGAVRHLTGIRDR